MEQANRTAFDEILTGLAAVYDKPLTDPLINAYWRALDDLSIEELAQAADRAIRSCRFFPKPAELRELIQGTPDDQAQNAWLRFWRAAERIGAYASVKFEDTGLCEAILRTFGSWPEACRATACLSDEMIRAKQKEFAANYRLVSRYSAMRLNNYLLGLHEITNSQGAESLHRLAGHRERIGLVTHTEVIEMYAPWNPENGRLETDQMRPIPQIKPAPDRPRLISGSQIEAPEEFKQALSEFVSRSAMDEAPDKAAWQQSPMTPEEWERRRELIKEQARTLAPSVPESERIA